MTKMDQESSSEREPVAPSRHVLSGSAAAAPTRVQRKRTKGWTMPLNAVAVGRGSEWGNPYKISVVTIMSGARKGEKEWWVENANINGVYMFKTRAEAQSAAVKLFRHWIEHNAPMNYKDRARLALRGRDLACWCALDQPCHADALLEIANGASASGAHSLGTGEDSATADRSPNPS
jgi:hypothetical protein